MELLTWQLSVSTRHLACASGLSESLVGVVDPGAVFEEMKSLGADDAADWVMRGRLLVF